METLHQQEQREARELKRAQREQRDLKMKDAAWRLTWKRYTVSNEELLKTLQDSSLIPAGELVSRGWDDKALYLTIAPRSK